MRSVTNSSFLGLSSSRWGSTTLCHCDGLWSKWRNGAIVELQTTRQWWARFGSLICKEKREDFSLKASFRKGSRKQRREVAVCWKQSYFCSKGVIHLSHWRSFEVLLQKLGFHPVKLLDIEERECHSTNLLFQGLKGVSPFNHAFLKWGLQRHPVANLMMTMPQA